MSDYGYLLIQAIFQALQLYSWGFALIEFFRNSRDKVVSTQVVASGQVLYCWTDGLPSASTSTSTSAPRGGEGLTCPTGEMQKHVNSLKGDPAASNEFDQATVCR